EHYIEELFTADEAKQLKDYLDREHGAEGATTINEVDLPIANNVMGVGMIVGVIGIGRGEYFYTLDEEPKYDLPFKVCGYLNLVGCELLDDSGAMRWQTNAEDSDDFKF